MHGSINHIAITVSDLDQAMKFFGPMLRFFNYNVGDIGYYAETRLVININPLNGIGINIWEAKTNHLFEVYEPGLHHVAINAGSKHQVDELARLVAELGAQILDGPAEFPFAVGGYYAVYFLGPDHLKFEVVYMPELEEV